jgi:hypothetical protein
MAKRRRISAQQFQASPPRELRARHPSATSPLHKSFVCTNSRISSRTLQWSRRRGSSSSYRRPLLIPIGAMEVAHAHRIVEIAHAVFGQNQRVHAIIRHHHTFTARSHSRSLLFALARHKVEPNARNVTGGKYRHRVHCAARRFHFLLSTSRQDHKCVLNGHWAAKQVGGGGGGQTSAPVASSNRRTRQSFFRNGVVPCACSDVSALLTS